MSWRVEERSQHEITCESGAKLSRRTPTQVPSLIEQLYQSKAATFQVEPTEDDRMNINKTATQTLDHVWGSLKFVFYILQVPAFCQSDRRAVPHEHLKNNIVEGQSNGVAGVSFKLISVKQVQLRVNLAQKHRG